LPRCYIIASSSLTGTSCTIEDPVEFLHPSAQSIVSQREVGIDTESYEVGLRNALRQAP
jgi:twitching motility protein PilU